MASRSPWKGAGLWFRKQKPPLPEEHVRSPGRPQARTAHPRWPLHGPRMAHNGPRMAQDSLRQEGRYFKINLLRWQTQVLSDYRCHLGIVEQRIWIVLKLPKENKQLFLIIVWRWLSYKSKVLENMLDMIFPIYRHRVRFSLGSFYTLQHNETMSTWV